MEPEKSLIKDEKDELISLKSITSNNQRLSTRKELYNTFKNIGSITLG